MKAIDMLADKFPQFETDADYKDIVSAFDKLRVAIAIFDENDCLTYCNTHFRYIFLSFKSLGQIIGMSYGDLLVVSQPVV